MTARGSVPSPSERVAYSCNPIEVVQRSFRNRQFVHGGASLLTFAKSTRVACLPDLTVVTPFSPPHFDDYYHATFPTSTVVGFIPTMSGAQIANLAFA